MADFEHDRLSVTVRQYGEASDDDEFFSLNIRSLSGEKLHEVLLWCYEGRPDLDAAPGKYQARCVCKSRPDGQLYWSISWINPAGETFISAHTADWQTPEEYQESIARVVMTILSTGTLMHPVHILRGDQFARGVEVGEV